jgi:formyltetrahydrofolate-dependent phosphoribosylglycinamide formyltransferase
LTADTLQPIAKTVPLSIAAMVSGQGRGSNVAALMNACAHEDIGCRIGVVIGTRADSPAIERARAGGANVSIVSPRKYENDEPGYGQALLRILEKHGVGLICLAGYMRKLPLSVLSEYAGKVMNIHPALLPFFGGQGMYGERVHQAVLESGMKVSGCTVHFVDEEYDTGPIILQSTVPVLDDDTPATLGQRVLVEEHATYIRAVKLFADGRLRIEGRRVRMLPSGEQGVTA